MNLSLLAIFIPLLLLQMFFAASEIALVSANRRRLRQRAEEGYRGAGLALRLLSAPERLLATTLMGSNLAEIANTILITALLLKLFDPYGEIIAVVFLPPLLLLLGEITPKSIARQQATGLARRLAPAVWIISWVFYPVTMVFAGVSRLVLLAVGARQISPLPFITREDLHLVVRKGGPEVDLEGQERMMIHRILKFSLRTVKEVMVPLVRVAAVPETLTVGQTLEEFRRTQYARLPVYQGRIDNLIGVLHGFDLLGVDLGGPIKPFIRPLHFVPEIKKIDLLLGEMQRLGIHLAAVVDEYGGVVGIVTIEDLLEEIVGEIADEFDQEVAPFMKLGEGHYLIRARMEIRALNEALHLDLPPGDYETLGGFLIAQWGDLPRVGEQLRFRDFYFVVRRADARAIKEVEVYVGVPPA